MSKTIGWVLLVVGLLAAYGAYSYDYGWVGIVVALIVALIGAWIAFSSTGQSSQPSM